MTRFIYDQFSKDHLDRFLEPRGPVETSKTVFSEIREIDVWFVSHSPKSPEEIGLLGQFACTPSLFEPYRDPVTRSEILDCLAKLAVTRENLQGEANRPKQRFAESDRPTLWILNPTAIIARKKCVFAKYVVNRIFLVQFDPRPSPLPEVRSSDIRYLCPMVGNFR